jgi:hypothetical protein
MSTTLDNPGREPPSASPAADEAIPAAGSLAAIDGNLPDGHRLMTRAEAAKAFEVSLTTFRRRYEGHILTPVVGPDGAHYFREEAVHELVIQRRSTATADAYDGETAATSFRLFEEGAHPVDVVLRLKVHPRVVRAMHREWVSLRGGYVVTGEIAQQIASLPWMWGSFPIQDGERLLANLRASAPHGLCAGCGDAVAQLCAACAKRMTVADAERRAAMERERREDLERAKRSSDWERDLAAIRKRAQKAKPPRPHGDGT